MATNHRLVDVANPESEQAGIEWWLELTARGGEGMVVKPLDFVVKGSKGLIHSAVKCRGPESLRIIYGPDYDSASNLSRLKNRGLGAQAIARPAGIRPRHRRFGAIRAEGTVATCSRMRVRRTGARE